MRAAKIKNMLQRKRFSELDINEPFFNSLKKDYPDFISWFHKKRNTYCYCVLRDGKLTDCMYVKLERADFSPYLYPAFDISSLKIKIGLFKCETKGVSHIFMNKIFEKAIKNKAKIIYTTFYKNDRLINFLQGYGFRYCGRQKGELVYVFDNKKSQS